MIDVLRKLEGSNQWIEVYTNSDDLESCGVIKILKLSEEFLLCEDTLTSGLSNGLYLMEVEDIIQIKTETKYIHKIDTLYKLRNSNPVPYNSQEEDPLMGILDHAGKNELIVSIALIDSDTFSIQGFVHTIGEEILEIRQIDDFGVEEGTAFVKLEDISSIACNDENGTSIKLLHELKK